MSRYKDRKDDRDPRADGMGPLKPVLTSINLSSSTKDPKELGMLPIKPIENEISKFVKEVSFAKKSKGRVPFNP